MLFLPPDLRTSLPAEPPGLVRTVDQADFSWNRPPFKAPQLNISVPAPTLEELREATRTQLRNQS